MIDMITPRAQKKMPTACSAIHSALFCPACCHALGPAGAVDDGKHRDAQRDEQHQHDHELAGADASHGWIVIR